MQTKRQQKTLAGLYRNERLEDFTAYTYTFYYYYYYYCFVIKISQSNVGFCFFFPADNRTELLRWPVERAWLHHSPRQHCWHCLYRTQRKSLSLSVGLCYFAPKRGTKYCDEYVCLSICLFVCTHDSKTIQPNFTTFLCSLPVAIASSFSDSIAICYVLPIVWMMSWSHLRNIKCDPKQQ